MKKVFLALMLVAAVAMGFTSCKKTASESDDHAQTFSLGETTYDINNVITIENIKYGGSEVYNAIILSEGKMVGNSGGHGHGVIIVYEGAIESGTFALSFNPLAPQPVYPKYFFTELEVDDIVNFNLAQLEQQDGVYVAYTGNLTVEKNGDANYTITTEGIEVEKIKDTSDIETSSVDYEGSVLRYMLATVEPGSNISGVNIATAGRTKYKVAGPIAVNIAAFIDVDGDMLGFFSVLQSFDNGIPEGSYTYNDYQIMFVEGMNIQSPRYATGGNFTVAKSGDVYTIDMTDLTFSGLEGTYTMHYVGTMPNFDFPF